MLSMKLRSLPAKINTAIITTVVVISLLFIIILYPMELHRHEDQIKRINLLLDTVFKQKINDLANELFARQERALKATLKEMKTVDGIAGVCVYDANAHLFLATDDQFHGIFAEKRISGTEKAPVFDTIYHNGCSLGVYANIIEVIGQKIGYILIYYDLEKLENESRQAVTVIVVLLIAAALLMAVLLNLFMFRSIIQPVSVLRRAMRRVEAGHLGETVILPGKDEIGDMGSAFNDMSLKLRMGREALSQAEEKYRSIFENAIEGIFQFSPRQGRFTTVNPSMAAILGYRLPEEVIQAMEDIGRQLFVNSADLMEYEQTLDRAGRIIGLEAELYTKTGSTIWASISARRVVDEDGRPLYDEGSFVDITERRQRQEAEREREAAESANRAKSEFLAKMSHEIRTPLNAILGFADILEGNMDDGTQRSHLSVIKSSGSNLLQLINDILDLSKIEAGRMEIVRTAVDLRSLTSELLSMFSVSAGRKGIDLRAVVAPDIPNFLMLDRARLRQVLFNLIGNAVKFTTKGNVEIRAMVGNTSTSNLWELRIEVHDTGPGIEAGALELIFESFHQHRSSRTSTVEGSGLGLAISKSLVELMNGVIRVESTPGVGSVFRLILPDTVASIPVGSDDGLEAGVPITEAALVFKPASLLVVDDLEVNRQLVVEALKDSPLRILESDNGQSAVAMAGTHRPDLILMDIKMPGLSGYEALALIRRHSAPEVPVIAITAAGMKEDILNIKAAGFDDYLIRPFNKTQLHQKLARFLKYEMKPSDTGIAQDPRNDTSAFRTCRESWLCPGQVAELLNGHYRRTWEKIRKRQHVPDIKQFSEEISRLGEKHALEVLTHYGQTLAGYAATIDVDNLKIWLDDYPAVLEGMHVPDEQVHKDQANTNSKAVYQP
jgi:PAS domain S-box-containing protein